MILEYFENKIQTKQTSLEVMPPSWVSTKNASFKAWKACEELKANKIRFIKGHHKVSNFYRKSDYLIKPSCVSSAIGLNRSTLMHKSSYSEKFSQYLADINEELEQLKCSSIKSKNDVAARGSIRNNKNQLLTENIELKKKINLLEIQNTAELARYAFDQLALPIRRKLGLE
jgi:hypothetical protein